MAFQVNLSNRKYSERVFVLKLIGSTLLILLILDALVECGKGKGRDILIYKGKVILKGGKKKGNIIISNGDSHDDGQGQYKYKKKYMDYGGFWR